MATRIKGPIKLLLYELVLVPFCLIFERNTKFFRQTETITWLTVYHARIFYMLVRVFHFRVFHVRVFHVRVFHVRIRVSVYLFN